MKKIFTIFILALSFISCKETLDTAFDVQLPITTDYPVQNRIFYNEFLAQGEVYGETEFKEYGFYCSDMPFTEDGQIRKIPAEQVDGEFFRAWIGELTEGSTYYVKAYGIDSGGQEVLGRQISVTTPSEKIEYVKVELLADEAELLNARHQKVCGKVTDLGGDEDGVIEYGAWYRPVGSDEPWLVTSLATKQNDEIKVDAPFEVIIKGLIPETEYEYMVYARNNRKEQFTQKGTFKTGTTTLPAVAMNRIDNVATTLFTVSGIVLDDGNDPDLECGFYLGTSENDTKEALLPDSTGEDGLFIVNKRGLIKETTYWLKPFARNWSGEAVGEVFSIKTGPESMPQVRAMIPDYEGIKSCVTANSVNITGFINSDGGLEITDCGIYWGKTPDSVTTKLSGILAGEYKDSIYVNVSGLNTCDVVYYQLYAENAKGEYKAGMESIGTKIEIPAWENAGQDVGTGRPNGWIRRSETLKEVYYEMPPFEVVEADGRKYKYYFLDRNLGAEKVVESASVSNKIEMIGSSYVYSYPKPGAVPSTGVVAQAKFGWVAKNELRCTDWNLPEYTPAPDNYYIPTIAEWSALIEAIPESERNLSGVFKLFRFGKTGNRQGNGGVFSKSIQYCTLYAADNAALTGDRAVFQARDKDSDLDLSGYPYMTVAYPAQPDYIERAVATMGGASVRCFRKMEVIEKD